MWIFKADISGCFNYIGPKVPRINTVNGVCAPSRNTHDQDDMGIWCCWCNAHHGVEPARRCNEQSEKRSEPMHSLHVCGWLLRIWIWEGCIGISRDNPPNNKRCRWLSVKKYVFSQTAEILGILVNCTEGTVRPKDKKALDKLCFVLFSIDIEAPQSLQYWQCVSSLVNLYSPSIRGMRPFVSAINHMRQES